MTENHHPFPSFAWILALSAITSAATYIIVLLGDCRPALPALPRASASTTTTTSSDPKTVETGAPALPDTHAAYKEAIRMVSHNLGEGSDPRFAPFHELNVVELTPGDKTFDVWGRVWHLDPERPTGKHVETWYWMKLEYWASDDRWVCVEGPSLYPYTDRSGRGPVSLPKVPTP